MCILHPPHYWDSARNVCLICESRRNSKEARLERVAAQMRAYYAKHGSGRRSRFQRKHNAAEASGH